MAYWLTGLLLTVVIVLAGLSVASRKAPDLGMMEGRLLPCPDTPNCVSSEDTGRPSSIHPLTLGDPPGQSWAAAMEAIHLAGGKIIKDSDGYLWATFTSRILRFTDDLELRRDTGRGLIHIRSASRVGHSDFGVNRKRVEKVTALYCRRANESGSARSCK